MYHMFGKYQGDKKFVENVGRCADIVVRATHIMASRYDDNLKKKAQYHIEKQSCIQNWVVELSGWIYKRETRELFHFHKS